MPNTYTPIGTSPSPTKGWTKVAVSSTTNATPVVVTTGSAHGFANGDTVELFNVGVAALNAQWQITVLSSTTFSLNGSTAPGSAGSGGYCVDYQLTPALSLISDGDLLNASNLNPPIEANANTGPFLYRRAGKWRMQDQFNILQGGYLGTGQVNSPWSTNTNFTATAATQLASTAFTLASLSDQSSIGPCVEVGDLLVFNLSLAAGIVTHTGAQNAWVQIGLGLVQGGTMTAYPYFGLAAANYTLGGLIVTPMTISGAFKIAAGGPALPATNLSLCLWGAVDYQSSSNQIDVNLVGPLSGSILQYRAN